MYDQKLANKTKYIDELKERNRHMRGEFEELQGTHSKTVERYERLKNEAMQQNAKNEEGSQIGDMNMYDLD